MDECSLYHFVVKSYWMFIQKQYKFRIWWCLKFRTCHLLSNSSLDVVTHSKGSIFLQ